jgi:hypothetical protein
MLCALVMLGRRHTRITTLLVAAVLGPGVVMFALGTVKRDLFDIRYLSTAVPVLTVLIARVVTAVPRRTLMVGLAGTVFMASLVFGLEDQQYNGANPRTYDFRGALALVNTRAQKGDVVYFDPTDLREVVQYYAPDRTLKPLSPTSASATSASGRVARRPRHVFIVASPSLMNGAHDAATLTHELEAWKKDQERLLLHRRLPNVEVWEFT